MWSAHCLPPLRTARMSVCVCAVGGSGLLWQCALLHVQCKWKWLPMNFRHFEHLQWIFYHEIPRAFTNTTHTTSSDALSVELWAQKEVFAYRILSEIEKYISESRCAGSRARGREWKRAIEVGFTCADDQSIACNNSNHAITAQNRICSVRNGSRTWLSTGCGVHWVVVSHKNRSIVLNEHVVCSR